MRLRFTYATERARLYERYIPFLVAILMMPAGLALLGVAPLSPPKIEEKKRRMILHHSGYLAKCE